MLLILCNYQVEIEYLTKEMDIVTWIVLPPIIVPTAGSVATITDTHTSLVGAIVIDSHVLPRHVIGLQLQHYLRH